MGKFRKRTLEKKARWQANHERPQRLIERRLEQERAADSEKQRRAAS
jgi:hypothetical protein